MKKCSVHEDPLKRSVRLSFEWHDLELVMAINRVRNAVLECLELALKTGDIRYSDLSSNKYWIPGVDQQIVDPREWKNYSLLYDGANRYGARATGAVTWDKVRFEIHTGRAGEDRLAKSLEKHFLESLDDRYVLLSVSFPTCPPLSWRISVLKRPGNPWPCTLEASELEANRHGFSPVC
ncbi:hypothetical protein Tco_1386107 [Tanacetum coccineum]